jgi:hypothetical protein
MTAGDRAVVLLQNVNRLDIALNFAINVAAALFVFLVGVFWNRIPKSWRDFRMRQFWGKDLFGGGFAVCHGTLQIDRFWNKPPGLVGQTQAPQTISSPFVKIYRDGSVIRISGPSENVMGDSEIRSASYLVRELSRGLKSAIEIEPDNRAFSRLNRSVVALGSGGSNEVTRLILQEPNNNFFDFKQEGREVFIHHKNTGKKYVGFRPPMAKDYGIIVKLPNLRFPGSLFFVCAGLGDWGTSGAAWYLASNWNNLRSQFPEAFGVVVEVDIGSDESARVISQVPAR